MGNWNSMVHVTKPENFVGVVIEKDGTLSTCVGIGSHTKIDGTEIPTLEWEITSKVTGEKRKRWTKVKFMFADLPIFFKGEKALMYADKGTTE